MTGLEYRLLDAEELSAGLAALSGWTSDGERIAKSFSFKTYKDGLVFATAVGFLADRLDHHPDMVVGYAKVEITVSTHSVKGLSPFDLELARRVEGLFGEA